MYNNKTNESDPVLSDQTYQGLTKNQKRHHRRHNKRIGILYLRDKLIKYLIKIGYCATKIHSWRHNKIKIPLMTMIPGYWLRITVTEYYGPIIIDCYHGDNFVVTVWEVCLSDFDKCKWYQWVQSGKINTGNYIIMNFLDNLKKYLDQQS